MMSIKAKNRAILCNDIALNQSSRDMHPFIGTCSFLPRDLSESYFSFE